MNVAVQTNVWDLVSPRRAPLARMVALTLGLLVVQASGPGRVGVGTADARLPATGQFWQSPPQTPHPAVARLIVPEHGGATSYGSGTLVDVHGDYGLVITNWHVVCDAAVDVTVVFPNGFRSAGRVLKVDHDWDLAVVAVWRPPIRPMPLATVPPRPGDVLTIAGYGSGQYRAATGRCTQYVAPGVDMPYEMVEVSVSAREGDSGGPIINQQGQLAGVLFGANRNSTSGSYAGRVRWFLASITQYVRNHDDAVAGNAKAADAPSASDSTLHRTPATEPISTDTARVTTPARIAADQRERPIPIRRQSPRAAVDQDKPVADDREPVTDEQSRGAEVQETPITWSELAGQSVWEQAKTVFALIGLLTVVLQLTRLSRG